MTPPYTVGVQSVVPAQMNQHHWPWLFAVSDLLWQVVVKLNWIYKGVILSGREEVLKVICNSYRRHPRAFILGLFHNTQVSKDFPFLLLPFQGYHLRTGCQVRGHRPLAPSKHVSVLACGFQQWGALLSVFLVVWAFPEKRKGWLCLCGTTELRFFCI